MSEIIDLENKIKELQKKELYGKWEHYLSNLKNKLELLKGKTILTWYANGRFVLYKIKDIQEHYYADMEGFYGQWSPKRWLELITEGYLICEVADDRGNYYRPQINSQSPFEFKFLKLSGKNKDLLTISKINFHNSSLNRSSWGELDRIYKIGFEEYNNKEYNQDPNYSRALDFLTLFSSIVDDGIYEAAYEVYKINVENTMKFWETYKNKTEKCTRVSDFLFK